MLHKIAVFMALITISFSARASTSNNNNDEPKASTSIINLPIETYLLECKTPKLMLGCGHNGQLDPKAVVPGTEVTMVLPGPTTGRLQTYRAEGRSKHTMDFQQSTAFHAHEGWYSVDMDPEMKPDVLGDLTQGETLDYVFQPERFQLVWPEQLPDALLTKNLFVKVAQCLKPSGSFICSLPGAAINGAIRLGQAASLAQIWKKAFDTEAGDFTKERGYKVQTEFASLAEIDALIGPYFKHMGFSEVHAYQSLGGLYCALSNQNCSLDEVIRLLDGRSVTKGSVLLNGPHPEAKALDDHFGNVFVGNLYIIAKK